MVIKQSKDENNKNFLMKIVSNFDTKLWVFLTPLLSVILGLITTGLFMLLLKQNPIKAYKLLFYYAFLDSYNFADIFAKATPLILSALAFGFAFRAKLFNIGAQGQFYLGCMATVFFALKFGELPIFIVLLLCLISSMIAGGIWASIVGFFKSRFNANEFLVSMMSTYVAIAIMDYLLRGPLKESKGEYPQTDVIPKSAWIPTFISNTRFHYGFFIAVAAAIVAYIILWKTTLGFKIRTVGMNRDAAKYAGIDEKKIFIIVFLISGAFAGLAGFMEINGIQKMAIQGFNPMIGAEGIGIAILGNANPFGIIFAALLYATIKVGGIMLTQTSALPSSIINVMQGFVMLFVVISYYIRYKILVNLQKKDLSKGTVVDQQNKNLSKGGKV